jgi:hypothetical protein
MMFLVDSVRSIGSNPDAKRDEHRWHTDCFADVTEGNNRTAGAVMENTKELSTGYRLRDSGTEGVWRAVAQVPEFVAEAAGTSDNYAQRLSEELWTRVDAKPQQPKALVEQWPQRDSERKTNVRTENLSWDLAVAFAICAAGMKRGPARGRVVKRCLDALESAIEAGHARPAPNHRDFVVVANNPRFLELASKPRRMSA